MSSRTPCVRHGFGLPLGLCGLFVLKRLDTDGRVCPAINAPQRVWLQGVFTPTEGCPVLLTLVHSSGLVRGLVRARPLVHSSVHSSTRPDPSGPVRTRLHSSGSSGLVRSSRLVRTRPDSHLLVSGFLRGGAAHPPYIVYFNLRWYPTVLSNPSSCGGAYTPVCP